MEHYLDGYLFPARLGLVCLSANRISLPGSVPPLLVFLHDRPSRYFLGPLAVPARFFGRFLDVFVLALLLGTNALEMFLSWHGIAPFDCVPLFWHTRRTTSPVVPLMFLPDDTAHIGCGHSGFAPPDANRRAYPSPPPWPHWGGSSSLRAANNC